MKKHPALKESLVRIFNQSAGVVQKVRDNPKYRATMDAAEKILNKAAALEI